MTVLRFPSPVKQIETKNWEPRLKLTMAEQAVLRAIVATKPARVVRRHIEAMLRQAHPEMQIDVRMADAVKRDELGEHAFIVAVDGVDDQGLVFRTVAEGGSFYGRA